MSVNSVDLRSWLTYGGRDWPTLVVASTGIGKGSRRGSCRASTPVSSPRGSRSRARRSSRTRSALRARRRGERSRICGRPASSGPWPDARATWRSAPDHVRPGTPRSSGAMWRATTRHGIVSPRGNFPSRGVAATTTPNHRPRMSQPSMRASTPVSSSRHRRQRSSASTSGATATTCGRIAASRRTADTVSARVTGPTNTGSPYAPPTTRGVPWINWWRRAVLRVFSHGWFKNLPQAGSFNRTM